VCVPGFLRRNPRRIFEIWFTGFLEALVDMFPFWHITTTWHPTTSTKMECYICQKVELGTLCWVVGAVEVPRWPMQVSYHSGVGSVTCLHSCGIMNISYYTRQNGWPAMNRFRWVWRWIMCLVVQQLVYYKVRTSMISLQFDGRLTVSKCSSHDVGLMSAPKPSFFSLSAPNFLQHLST